MITGRHRQDAGRRARPSIPAPALDQGLNLRGILQSV